jgi:hypothetical protein
VIDRRHPRQPPKRPHDSRFPLRSFTSFTSLISHLPYLLPSSVSPNSFACHSYENCRGVYPKFPIQHSRPRPSASFPAPHSLPRIPFAFTFLRTLLHFSALTKKASSLLSIVSALRVKKRNCQLWGILPISELFSRHSSLATILNWLSSIPSAKIASLPTAFRQIDRAIEESL